MSTIKANKLESISTSNGGIQLDSAGHVTVDGVQMPTAGTLSHRNLVVNGAMQVSQRGTSFTSNPNDYTLDRWRFSTSGGVFDVVQSSTAPEGFSNSLKVDCTTTTTPTGNQEGFVETKIEAQDLQHLQYGTSGAQSITLSFHVKSNKTGSYGLWFYQEDASSQYATTYTISAANTWEYKTITIPGNTAAAINDDNGVGLNFRFYLLAGPGYAGTPAETWTTTLTSNRTTSLNLGDSTANEWLISGVQLEVGTKATAFEHKSYSDELQRCLRYFYKAAWAFCNKIAGIGYRFIPPGPATVMRTAPAHSYFNPDTGTANQAREHSSGTGYTINDNTNANSTAQGPTTYFGTSSSTTYGVQCTIHYDAEL